MFSVLLDSHPNLFSRYFVFLQAEFITILEIMALVTRCAVDTVMGFVHGDNDTARWAYDQSERFGFHVFTFFSLGSG